MFLQRVRVTKYRSIRDSGWFDVEKGKTILIGPNEAGKTALLEAIQRINPPLGTRGFDPLRDYPRSEFDDISSGKILAGDVTVVEAHFELDPEDKEALEPEFCECEYVVGRKLDNNFWHNLIGGPPVTKFGDIKKDLARLCAHIDSRVPPSQQGMSPPSTPILALYQQWKDDYEVVGPPARVLKLALEKAFPNIEEGNATEEKRYDDLIKTIETNERRATALWTLQQRLPLFIRFRDFFRVRPLIHLDHLATRIEKNLVDDDYYDYGNKCLLKLLGFSARELSNLGKTDEPLLGDAASLQTYRDQLDRRSYQLNAASVRLTDELRATWMPDSKRDEAERLRIVADGQYLKVIVEDDVGVEIELDQRSEGFQWLVSFFIVFFAESANNFKNAILLLDEPGLSLHALKQREFRTTISRLAESNQTLYTTHSPFLVGPDELNLVRVVEMTDRTVGTKVRTNITAEDPVALLPLQEALGYDLAQSLFAQPRNLVLESLTDYWYLDAVAQLLRDAGIVDLSDKISVLPASGAGKVVYYATILHAHKLKVAALLDSEMSPDQAAHQERLVHALGNKSILRTKDVYEGPLERPAVEDLLRDTLIHVARTELGWDVAATADAQPERSVVDVFKTEINDFTKYRLAKAFVRWTRDHQARDLSDDERTRWKKLITSINGALR
ncbi:MAG TPA: AAA family ATPase [Chthoniobacterales bacterium]|nr:AAA family ATPase [Chthoniobacterales bacterium]